MQLFTLGRSRNINRVQFRKLSCLTKSTSRYFKKELDTHMTDIIRPLKYIDISQLVDLNCNSKDGVLI